MTDEEALRLARLAWADAVPQVLVSNEGSHAIVLRYDTSVIPEMALYHRDRTRFEAALRVLAGEP